MNGGVIIKGKAYIQIAMQQMEEAWYDQQEVIQEIIGLLCQGIIAKKSLYVFGCSHAGLLAQELFYRTGGLALFNPIFYSGMMLDTRPVTMTSQTERLEGIGKMLLEQYGLKKDDILIIHSVSGRNTVPVEMALEAKQLGVKVIVLTNLAYSKAVSSRHPSGKNLYEVADWVLDNRGVCGDGCITFEAFNEASGPTSTVVGAALLNAIVVEVVEHLIQQGINPPVFMSANLDGGDAYNQSIFEAYKENIFYQ